MSLNFTPATGALAALDLLRIEIAGAVAHIRQGPALDHAERVFKIGALGVTGEIQLRIVGRVH